MTTIWLLYIRKIFCIIYNPFKANRLQNYNNHEHYFVVTKPKFQYSHIFLQLECHKKSPNSVLQVTSCVKSQIPTQKIIDC